MLEPPISATAVLERRQQALAALARALEQETQREIDSLGRTVPSPRFTAELIVGGVFSAIRARILERRIERPSAACAELVPSLMAFIAFPYGRVDGGAKRARLQIDGDRRDSRSERAPMRATYRSTRVLSAIGASPCLSNREIADAAGLTDEGQTSKLLRRLERRGLVENVGLGHAGGGANAWLLTAYGERVLDATRHSLVPGAGAVSGQRVRGTT